MVGGTIHELGLGLQVQPLAWDFPHLLKFMGLRSGMESWLGAWILESQFWGLVGGVPVPCCAIDMGSCVSHLTSPSLDFVV